MTFKMDTILDDLETIFKKTVDPKIDLTDDSDPPIITHPIIWSNIYTGRKEKPSLANGNIGLLGLNFDTYKDGMGGNDKGDILVVFVGLVKGLSSTAKKLALHYGDLMIDEVNLIKDGDNTDWTIQGYQITIPKNNSIKFSEFRLDENAEKPECSGFALTFMITKNNE